MASASQTTTDRENRNGQPAPSTIRRAARSLWDWPVTQMLLGAADAHLPPLRLLHQRLYDRQFARVVPWARRFRGVYATFEEAVRAAPATKPVGYNNPGAAKFMQPSRELSISDYPVLFWLQKCLQESPSLLDIGGYVGISYYSYKRYLDYPDNLEWVIQDVPAVIGAGAEIARNQQSHGLSFVAEVTPALRAQTVLADGSLQFIKESFTDLLMRMGSLPKHLIVSKMPLTDLPDFITLQDLGPAVCPYKIFNRARFIESVEALGYRLVDSWENIELDCRIPFYPEQTVRTYSGLYFQASK